MIEAAFNNNDKDGLCLIVQPWIYSTELQGKHPYENRNTTSSYME